MPSYGHCESPRATTPPHTLRPRPPAILKGTCPEKRRTAGSRGTAVPPVGPEAGEPGFERQSARPRLSPRRAARAATDVRHRDCDGSTSFCDFCVAGPAEHRKRLPVDGGALSKIREVFVAAAVTYLHVLFQTGYFVNRT